MNSFHKKSLRKRGLKRKAVDVKCAKLVFYHTFDGGCISHQMAPKTDMKCFYFGPPSPYYDSSENDIFKHFKKPEHRENRRPKTQIAKASGPPCIHASCCTYGVHSSSSRKRREASWCGALQRQVSKEANMFSGWDSPSKM